MPHLDNKKILRIYGKHLPYPEHLLEVLDEMEERGPPVLKCVEFRGEYFALEGSQRLAAAHILGLVPIIDLVEPDSTDPSDEEFWEQAKYYLPHYTWFQ